ncbi:MAG: amidohydrolase, partial [Clostridia bacterium]|nr:amidohydrolase [Clostridia bacterium]
MQTLLNAADKHRSLILESECYIWQHPETGYREEKTSQYMKEVFTSLGYELECPEDITGFITRIDTGRPGPELLILGELDSIICPNHPEADPKTGAVHSCGHNAQCAAL